MNARLQAGHLREKGTGWTGAVEGLGGSAGDNIEAPTREVAQAALLAAAKNLGWSPPYRWDGPDADGVVVLIATDSTAPEPEGV